MTNLSLAQNYLAKAKSRLKSILVLQEDKDYSDVVREAQEIVELSLKAMLWFVGIEPPKWHDVGPLLLEKRTKFPSLDAKTLETLSAISTQLRAEREKSFYGDPDFIPSEEYGLEDGKKAISDAAFIVAIAEKIVR